MTEEETYVILNQQVKDWLAKVKEDCQQELLEAKK
jgi:hypothetical protein